MDPFIDNIPQEPEQEHCDLELLSMKRDSVFSPETWSSPDDLGWVEFHDEEDIEIGDDSDAEQDYETDGDSSVDDYYVSESIEYVRFGKWLEYDGDQWGWEEDIDVWSEMSR